jgi:hypothetical protein
MEIEVITLVAGAVIIVVDKIIKKIRYNKEKRKLKKKLIKSIQENDKNKIKKYVIKLKDFDTRFNKKKLLKYLELSNRNINGLNQENIYSLLNDFSFLDMIYESEEDEINIDNSNNLNEKLKELEKKRKEILIRNNQLQAKALFKNNKMLKNMGKKKKKGKLS